MALDSSSPRLAATKCSDPTRRATKVTVAPSPASAMVMLLTDPLLVC